MTKESIHSKNVFILPIIFFCFVFHSISILAQLKIQDISKNINFGHRIGKRNTDSIDIIIIHSNYYKGNDPYSPQKCIYQFRKYDVAPHYLITRKGEVIQLVKECDVAWHAGNSNLKGTKRYNLNTNSIGIEIINTRYTAPNPQQYTALKLLTMDIRSRYRIQYILGHSDCASGRKDDPWNFDWEQYYNSINWVNK